MASSAGAAAAALRVASITCLLEGSAAMLGQASRGVAKLCACHCPPRVLTGRIGLRPAAV